MDILALAIVGVLALVLTEQIHSKRGQKWRSALAASREALARSEGRIHHLEDQCTMLKTMLDAAHETIVELRREGFELPPASPELPERPASMKVPGVVMEAIHGIARPGELLYNQLVAEAQNDLEVEGAKPDDVAQKIAEGSSYSPYA